MDLFIILIFLLMIGFGLYRGFIKEILGLFSLSCSLFLSVICNKWIIDNVFHSIENRFIVSIAVYCVTFMFFIIIFNIIMRYILGLFVAQSDSLMDRFFGGVIGFVKAYLFCFFIYFIIFSFSAVLKPDFDKENKIEDVKEIAPEWLKNSRTFPVFFSSIIRLDHIIKKFNSSDKDIKNVESEDAKNTHLEDSNILQKDENNSDVKVDSHNEDEHKSRP